MIANKLHLVIRLHYWSEIEVLYSENTNYNWKTSVVAKGFQVVRLKKKKKDLKLKGFKSDLSQGKHAFT